MSDADYRDFTGRVALISLLRVVHVVGIVGLGAAMLSGRGPGGIFLFALVASGAGVALLDRWSNRAYFRQVSGLAVLLKAVLLASLAAVGLFDVAVFWALLAFSVLIAHAPSRLRHRKVI